MPSTRFAMGLENCGLSHLTNEDARRGPPSYHIARARTRALGLGGAMNLGETRSGVHSSNWTESDAAADANSGHPGGDWSASFSVTRSDLSRRRGWPIYVRNLACEFFDWLSLDVSVHPCARLRSGHPEINWGFALVRRRRVSRRERTSLRSGGCNRDGARPRIADCGPPSGWRANIRGAAGLGRWVVALRGHRRSAGTRDCRVGSESERSDGNIAGQLNELPAFGQMKEAQQSAPRLENP